MKLKQYIKEDINPGVNIPQYFRVIIDIEYSIDKGVGKQLQQRKLEGMRGISASSEIVFEWLGAGRDAMLLMKGTDVVKINDLSRIDYNNPEYMLANNMFMLKRVWNKSDYDIQQTMFNLCEYIFKAMLKDYPKWSYEINANAPYQSMSYKHKNANINNVKDLIKWWDKTVDILSEEGNATHFFKSVKKEISSNKLKKYIQDAFDFLQKIYGSEAEWYIGDNVLNIPKNSYLYILMRNIPKHVIDDFNAGKETIETKMQYRYDLERYTQINNVINKHKLDKIYKLKYVDKSEWEKIKKIHWRKK